eukprot:02776.XXX_84921_81597_1 [CDS] Oithona nana genome sequencing.
METLGTPHGYGPPVPLGTRLDQRAQSSGGDDEPMSDNELSRDGESPDALSRVPPTDVDPETLEKLKQQVNIRFFLDFCPNSGSNDNNNTNETRDLRTPTSLPKDPPPIGLAGLEAFRREYLTSPLSN